MRKAWSMLRPNPSYRSESFIHGLSECGFECFNRNPNTGPSNIDYTGDVLIIWNRYGGFHQAAVWFEQRNGTVIVAENGYYGTDDTGIQRYAISLDGHHASGRYMHDESRLSDLLIRIEEWREFDSRKYVLICGQRGIGSPEMKSPVHWHINLAKKLRIENPSVEFRVRNHPECRAPEEPPVTTLNEDLEGAQAVIVWSSNSGILSLMKGIPTYFGAPHYMMKGAAFPLKFRGNGFYYVPFFRDVKLAFARMAANQYTVSEISSGLPFRRLLCTFMSVPVEPVKSLDTHLPKAQMSQ